MQEDHGGGDLKGCIEIACENKEGIRVAFAMGKLPCYTWWNNRRDHQGPDDGSYRISLWPHYRITPQDRVAFGQWLCLYVPCNLLVCHSRRDYPVHHTPYHSPESNGMAESFVKTFKRDYVYYPYLTRCTNRNGIASILVRGL